MLTQKKPKKGNHAVHWVRCLCLLVGGLLALVLSACDSEADGITTRRYWPTESWETSDPDQQDIDGMILRELRDELSSDRPYVTSVLAVRRGYVVFERYANEDGANELNDIYSVTKSVTSALAGIAIEQGSITANTTLSDGISDRFADGAHSDKGSITLLQLLGMRSGIDFDEEAFHWIEFDGDAGQLEPWVRERDVVDFVLNLPMRAEPDATWSYATTDTHLAAALIEDVVGTPLSEYAERHLFGPLGIRRYEWTRDASGTTVGGALLRLTTRDLAKLGYLYLNRGTWDGEQVVPESWVALTTTAQPSPAYWRNEEAPRDIAWYGYGWWTWTNENSVGGHPFFAAEGHGGQLVAVYPDLDLVVVVTCRTDVNPNESELQRYGSFQIAGRIARAITDASFRD